MAYALSVVGAMFRWLIQQRYLLANPFAGIKVRGASRSESLAVTRVFGEGEWSVIQAVAEGLEWGHGWHAPAAQRLRFVLDFAYATGLRTGELVAATLGQIEIDAHGDHWLHLVGKGSKAGKVALPPLARAALDRYLMQRKLPITPARWDPRTPLIGSLDQDDGAGTTTTAPLLCPPCNEHQGDQQPMPVATGGVAKGGTGEFARVGLSDTRSHFCSKHPAGQLGNSVRQCCPSRRQEDDKWPLK